MDIMDIIAKDVDLILFIWNSLMYVYINIGSLSILP